MSDKNLAGREGIDDAYAKAAKASYELTDIPNADQLIPVFGLPTEGGKVRVNVFVSYANADAVIANDLLDRLKAQFKVSRYAVHFWVDQDAIKVGERWAEKIQTAIKNCDFGLMLLSVHFSASDYIREHELPKFRGTGSKPAIPVGLCRFDFETQDPLNLRQLQIFRLEKEFFDHAEERKGAFAHELYRKINGLFDEWVKSKRGEAPVSAEQRGVDAEFEGKAETEQPFKQIYIPEEARDFQRTRGIATTIAGLVTLDGKAPSLDQARDALEELEAWATKPGSPPFFALLGEYGMGKTTTLKQFTRHLLAKIEQSPEARSLFPLPIYVDLRNYVGDRYGPLPTVEELLDEIIRRSWKLSDRTITAKEILRLVRQDGAIIIFDGLDERIVHMPPDQSRLFIRTLWSALPDAAMRPGSTTARRGKMILSCRSHYFRNVLSQNSMLLGENREGLDAETYPALCLLPFTEAQIRSYLQSRLGTEEKAKAAFDLIARIHNLPDLAQRPYLLFLIAGKLKDLEDLTVQGKTVNAARLYDLFVQDWLNRDDGKHQIAPAHKRRLMESLAAAMWRERSKEWDADRLESWFDEFLYDRDNQVHFSPYLGKDREVLKEDLRTATFVLRPDTNENHFRFAHSSLQEFFLASYLARALREKVAARWDLPMPSRETLEFLGQLLALDYTSVHLETFDAIFAGECLRAALITFRYWLTALEKGLPEPHPRHVSLASANLEEWTIRGRSPEQPLSLRGANLAGVRLNRSRLENVDLSGADLTKLEARHALFLHVQAANARLVEADLTGLQWRGGSLARGDLADACLAGCQWILVDLTAASLPEGWSGRACAVGLVQPLPTYADVALQIQAGYAGYVSFCAWSPDGSRLASASDDRTLRLWDATDGRWLQTLEGHTRGVRSCAWNPDGSRLASASDDTTLRIWDATDGRCLCSLRGHSNGVRSCAWSPDGSRLASTSIDNTLQIWDATAGRCMRSLARHTHGVRSCAWSPDGSRLASTSIDSTIQVWDATDGRLLRTLEGHTDSVLSCAWSPDGSRLASASGDKRCGSGTSKVVSACGPGTCCRNRSLRRSTSPPAGSPTPPPKRGASSAGAGSTPNSAGTASSPRKSSARCRPEIRSRTGDGLRAARRSISLYPRTVGKREFFRAEWRGGESDRVAGPRQAARPGRTKGLTCGSIGGSCSR